MKIYDITQKIFGCRVFPGDRVPKLYEDIRMRDGALYNLSSFEMCAHNGTHIDAPFHFIENGDMVENIPLSKTVGYCYVAEENGNIDKATAEKILKKAMAFGKDTYKRILIKGKGIITEEGVAAFTEAGIYLLGVEGQTVGPADSPMQVHKILLSQKVVLLEGAVLFEIDEGEYFLNCAPISLNGCDGAPCRAILIKEEN